MNGTLAIANELVQLCRKAGEAIKDVYCGREAMQLEQKADNSPVTAADKLANQIILEALATVAPQWPVLSEEHTIPDFQHRSAWPCYWLVDPLDGTREFIARTGEFTVNIALIEQGVPVLGVVYLPLEDVAYVGLSGHGAWRESEGLRSPITVSTMAQRGCVRVLTSSRHGGEQLETCINRLSQHFGDSEWIKAGSALKFCRLAEGLADIYPRFSPCSEWDTAAGQAVLEAAGGQLLDTNFEPLRYNQKSSLLNPHFYALGGEDVDWPSVLSAAGTPERGA